MVKKKLKPFVIPVLYLTLVVLFFIMTYLLSMSLNIAQSEVESDYTYVSYEILMDNVIPVIGQQEVKIIRPFTDEDVVIGKSFYDYTQSEEQQIGSIVYFENTYIQNSGVDYVSNNVFNCLSILDGKVISISEDDIVGKSIKIRHSDDTISIYQSLSEILVLENDSVEQGQVIGKSGTNALGNDLGNHLHFELFYHNELVNPELYFDQVFGEI